MKISEIYFCQDSFGTLNGIHVKHLKADPKLDLELDLPTLSVRVTDKNFTGAGVYHIPLASLRRWSPAVESPAQSKKAANQ